MMITIKIIVLLFFLFTNSNIYLLNSNIITVCNQDDLQNIIDIAEPYDIIILTDQNYETKKTITIDKPLHLMSLKNKATITMIENNYSNIPVLKTRSKDVFFSNLMIINKNNGIYSSGIRIIEDNTIVEYCSFKDTPVGIDVWSNNNVLKNNNFYNCSDEGIVFIGVHGVNSNNNHVSECTFIYCCDGIELQSSKHNMIENCSFIDNTHCGIDGIIKDNNKNTISNCTFINNMVSAIYMTGSYDNNIENCMFKNNTEDIITN